MPLRSVLSSSIKNVPNSIFERKKNPIMSQRTSCLTLKREIPCDFKEDVIENIKKREHVVTLKKKLKKRLPGMRLIKDFISSHYSQQNQPMDSKIENSEIETTLIPTDEDQKSPPSSPTEKKKKIKKKKTIQEGGSALQLAAADLISLLQEFAKSITSAMFRGKSKEMKRSEFKTSKEKIIKCI